MSWRAGLVQAVEAYRLWPEGPGFESRSPRIAQARVRLATDTLPQTPHRAGALCPGYAPYISICLSILLFSLYLWPCWSEKSGSIWCLCDCVIRCSLYWMVFAIFNNLYFFYFLKVHWKWSSRITKALNQCMESKEYMEIRNALIVLTKISSVFPVIRKSGVNLEKRVSPLPFIPYVMLLIYFSPTFLNRWLN